MTVLEQIALERERQIAKGYDAAHDDEHPDGSIARAASVYVLHGHQLIASFGPPHRPFRSRPLDPRSWWPWSSFKPKTKRQNLIIAAALLVAEIERIDRTEEDRHT